MIRIKRKEVFYSTLSYICSTIQSVIISAIILSRISKEEFALWSVFLSLQAFIVLLDAGFGSVIVRYSTYAFSGVGEIPASGVPTSSISDGPNYGFLFEVLFAAKRVYRKIAIFAFIILLMLTAYIYYLSAEINPYEITLTSWMVFSAAVSVDIYFTYFSNFMKGIGMITASAKINVITIAVNVVVQLCFVLAGAGLLGLAIAYFIRIVISRVLMCAYTRRLFLQQKHDYSREKELANNNKNSELVKGIWKNSKQLTLVTITDFITGKGTTLVCSAFFPLSVTAMFSITNQLIGIAVSLSSLPYSTFRYKWGESIPKGNKDESKNVLSLALVSVFFGTAIGSVAIAVFGPFALRLIHSQTELLGPQFIAIIALYQLVMLVIKIATSYIQYKNIQPFAKSYLISSLAGIIISIPFLLSGYGLAAYLLSILIVQLVYNAWKWPIYVIKELDLHAKEIITRGIGYAILVAKGKN